MAQLKELKNRHYIAAACLATGMDVAETAALVGLKSQSLAVLSTSPLFIAEMDRIRQKLQEALVSDAVSLIHGEALNNLRTLITLRDNPNVSPTVRSRIAQDMLDRTVQTSKVHKQSVAPPAPQFTAEQAESITRFLEDDPIAHEAFMRAANQPLIDLNRVKADSGASAEDTIEKWLDSSVEEEGIN